MEREKAWNKWRTNKRLDLWNNYIRKRNEYVKTCIDEQKNFEKNVVEKCKDQPKLFYKFINGKLKSKDEISMVKAGEETVDDPEEVAEVFNRYFHSVFTKENDFRGERTALEKGTDLKQIKTSVEVKNMLEDLDVRKAMGPDGVSSWIFKV